MIFIELLVPKGVLEPLLRPSVASVQAASAGGRTSRQHRGAGRRHRGGAADGGRSGRGVRGAAPGGGERAGGSGWSARPGGRPRFLVRAHVPGPWRKDLSETLSCGVTRILVQECGVAETAYSDLDVQVHVVGVPECGIGLRGAVTTSQGIVDLMDRPLSEAAVRGEVLRPAGCWFHWAWTRPPSGWTASSSPSAVWTGSWRSAPGDRARVTPAQPDRGPAARTVATAPAMPRSRACSSAFR